MAIITITRGQHSGGEEVAQAIADQIGARCVSNEVLREAAQNTACPKRRWKAPSISRPPSGSG